MYGAVGDTLSTLVLALLAQRCDLHLVPGGSTTKVGASVSYDATAERATFDPSKSLQRGITYKAVITTEAKDLAGNSLDQNPTLSGLQQ